jgi:hypothetical protein
MSIRYQFKIMPSPIHISWKHTSIEGAVLSIFEPTELKKFCRSDEKVLLNLNWPLGCFILEQGLLSIVKSGHKLNENFMSVISFIYRIKFML